MTVSGTTRRSGHPSPPGPHVHAGTGPARRVVGLDHIYRQISSGRPCWISAADGGRRPLPIGRWLGGEASTEEDRRADGALLDLCVGPTVDVGCGPGRFTAALADRGVDALGVDISAAAVEMTVRRGGRAIHSDVFAPMPGAGHWSHVLLADGNIGIGGDPLRMLRRARQLLRPGGGVVAEFETHPSGVQTERRRWETHHSVGRWFPWALVGCDAAEALAQATGFLLVSAVEFSERCVVVMRVA